MSGTIKTPIVSMEEGYLADFQIAYRSIRMVLWTAPDIQIGGLTMRAAEDVIGALSLATGRCTRRSPRLATTSPTSEVGH